jgi:hypothetical protein
MAQEARQLDKERGERRREIWQNIIFMERLEKWNLSGM